MPYAITTFTLPCGVRCVRVVGSGHIVKEDADHLMSVIGQGGSESGRPKLFLAQEVKSIASEARSLFSSGFDPKDQSWSGLVVTNPLIRMTSNLMSRVSGYRKSKMFSTEEEAIRWLDERVREDAAKAKATG